MLLSSGKVYFQLADGIDAAASSDHLQSVRFDTYLDIIAPATQAVHSVRENREFGLTLAPANVNSWSVDVVPVKTQGIHSALRIGHVHAEAEVLRFAASGRLTERASWTNGRLVREIRYCAWRTHLNELWPERVTITWFVHPGRWRAGIRTPRDGLMPLFKEEVALFSIGVAEEQCGAALAPPPRSIVVDRRYGAYESSGAVTYIQPPAPGELLAAFRAHPVRRSATGSGTTTLIVAALSVLCSVILTAVLILLKARRMTRCTLE